MTTSLELKLKPTQFRLLFLVIFLIGTTLIWGAYFSGIYFVQNNAQDNLEAKVRTLALILEDHASRSLDAVTVRLKSVAAVTTPAVSGNARLTSSALMSVIFNDNIIRSLSLVDDQGRVIASSSEQNIGIVLPEYVLAPLASGGPQPDIRFDRVLPYRDLNEIGRLPASPALNVLLASLALQSGGKHYHWIAALNPGFFHNLWTRVNQDPATGALLMNDQGLQIVVQNDVWTGSAELADAIKRHAAQSDRGSFSLVLGKQSLDVSYRAVKSQPVILAVVGNVEKALGQLSEQRHYFLATALCAFFVLIAVIALLSRVYLRYERSLIEMTNQAKAITAHLMVSESSPDGRMTSVNQAFQDVSGFTAQELIGQSYGILSSHFHPPEFYQQLWNTIRAGKIWKGVFRNADKAGHYFWVNATIIPFTNVWGQNTRYVAFYSDVTKEIGAAQDLGAEKTLREALAAMNQQLITAVNTDVLTQIPNRRAFDLFSKEALINARNINQSISLLMIDIDKFKAVNDTYGHAAGDLVLREAAARWTSLIRTSDMVARIGGEEFCIVLPQTSDLSARRIAQKLLKAISAQPFDISECSEVGSISMTVSIGLINVGLANDLTIQTIVGFSDEALYAAKGLGGNCIVNYKNLSQRLGRD